MCFDIEYWRSCRPFLATTQLQWIKIYKKCLHCIAVTFWLPNQLEFELDGFQPHHPAVILTTCIIIFMGYTVYLSSQVSQGHFHFFVNTFFFKFWFYHVHDVVTHVLPGTFHFLTKPRIFPVYTKTFCRLDYWRGKKTCCLIYYIYCYLLSFMRGLWVTCVFVLSPSLLEYVDVQSVYAAAACPSLRASLIMALYFGAQMARSLIPSNIYLTEKSIFKIITKWSDDGIFGNS